MAIAYDGINYFPVGVNFMEENKGFGNRTETAVQNIQRGILHPLG